MIAHRYWLLSNVHLANLTHTLRASGPSKPPDPDTALGRPDVCQIPVLSDWQLIVRGAAIRRASPTGGTACSASMVGHRREPLRLL